MPGLLRGMSFSLTSSRLKRAGFRGLSGHIDLVARNPRGLVAAMPVISVSDVALPGLARCSLRASCQTEDEKFLICRNGRDCPLSLTFAIDA